MTDSSRRFPIGEYGLIGDTRTAALIAPDGSIDWLCLPRFDSPPLFGRLVGGDEAGWFLIGPEGAAMPARRSYRGDTATLETVWEIDRMRLVLADAMVAEVSGRLVPNTMLVRRVSAQGGPIRVRIDVQPRFGYRRKPAGRVRHDAQGLVLERSGMAVAVSTDPMLDLTGDGSVVVDVEPNRPVTIVLSVAYRAPCIFVPPALAVSEVERDESGWQQWSDTLVTGPDHRAAMVRSLITLQLLSYSPSGAPIAAPTTSLPEQLGGERNWDYRYAWPRDASIGIGAFLDAGKDHEARAFLAWLLNASRLSRPWLPAVFALDGRPVPRERVLEGWPGYAASRPVRLGNEAGRQHQLDGYGWVLEAAWQLTRRGHELDGETWRTMRAYADQVNEIWMRPDAGIWERRDGPRHHVHSKLMAWVALDRAGRIAEHRGDSSRRSRRWRGAAELLGAEIRDRGFDPHIGSYTATYWSPEADAALLVLPMVGLEQMESPRVAGTVDWVREQLSAGGPLLYRYRDDDGMTEGEGAFLPCSFWLVEALALTGRTAEARDLFQRLVELGGPLGLYGEQMDPVTGEHLGNFPQALTHSTLLQAANTLNESS